MKKEPILQMGSDQMIPRHVYDNPFTVRFPERSEWKDGFQPDTKGGLYLYRDGFKAHKGTGSECMAMAQGENLVSALGST
jgi:hypothetical protein